MKIFRHPADVPAEMRGAVVAIGNFDGVHHGHRAVIARAHSLARAAGAPSAALTFEPHPHSVFRPHTPPFRLTPLRAKMRCLTETGIDAAFVLRFDAAFSHMTAHDFARGVLAKGLGVRHAVVGHDFVFGHGRTGNAEVLQRFGAEFGFGVTRVDPVVGANGAIHSSTRIRELLIAGEPKRAAALLGRPWEIEGRVRHGDRRGRTIGFPTANIELGAYLRPAFGVYAVRVGIDRGTETVWHDGVANLGRRPTVSGVAERLEVHVFDFEGDLYGRRLCVHMNAFLRPERRFGDLAALTAQIRQDTEKARAELGLL